MIDYYLKQNKLKSELLTSPKGEVSREEGNKYCAQVVNSRSYTFDDIAKHLLKHNIGLSSSAIYGLWEGIKGAVEEFISEGGSIKTELFHVHTSIKGVFNGLEDGFDSSRHTIKLNLRPGILLRDTPKSLRVKKIKSAAKSMILSVTDINSGSVNWNLTPGKNIRIVGQRVKIDGKDPSCGLYFIPEKSNQEPVKIELNDVVMNKPSQLIAVVPKLNKGLWNLRLVTQFGTGKHCYKEPQNITFDKKLSVA